MFSIFLNPQQSAAFGQFLAKLGGLALLALAVWAALFAAAASQHESQLQPGVIAAANPPASPTAQP